ATVTRPTVVPWGRLLRGMLWLLPPTMAVQVAPAGVFAVAGIQTPAGGPGGAVRAGVPRAAPHRWLVERVRARPGAGARVGAGGGRAGTGEDGTRGPPGPPVLSK